MDILITVSGNGVTVGEVTGGQIDCLPFADDNAARLTLRELIRKYWGHPNTVVVQDAEFGTGYYRVRTGCSAGGHGWSYRLDPVLTGAEAVKIHDTMVRQALAGQQAGPSGLTAAFSIAAAQ